MVLAMQAVEFGGPEALHAVTVEPGEPGPGRVRIRVRAAGVNPADAKLLRGLFGRGRTPVRPGSEVAGVVTAVGEAATGPLGDVRVGDEVVAFRVSGGYSEELVVPAASVLPKPPGLAWEQSAGLLLTGTTAVHLLEATHVSAGDTVLIHGASGAVGSLLVQLVRERGARVIGTSSERGAAIVERFGGESVRYGEGLVERVRALAPGGIDVALDTAGTDDVLDASVELVADRSRIATVAGFERGAALGVLLLGGGAGADPGTALRDAARAPLLERAGRGALEVVLGPSFPLAEAAEALALVESGRAGGKVVLLP
ncbi:NADPH:quinone reductase-like Zn-dependent oxidoreductase [Rathayibacter sp. PhB93]|uniref:quinone oxidoreductase family protein n=1 Tax=unclassified Rathayibacter TaxID=2609250 RepID=UPI000FBDE45C|nr:MULTISPECIES: NADP-dependent oxidoreductase [unclassified Rathayibacter]ROQ04226.1 NADPH:quinone reductase-like Zn-dependent oxidoreductase [Rathayibacter sp. PhB93]TDQ13063.1 NADPH:quinone reductase-like Zn-dependent oxidoreductase [Rathayibacter sp. PhB1]